MREVRMTFGEHLEELRRRIFWALFWLSLAVAVCFYFGRPLLQWTKGPYDTAVRGALRDQAISHLDGRGKELLELKDRGAAAAGGAWDDLFTDEQRQARARRVLEEAFPPEERPRMLQFLEAISGSAWGLPERFRLLEADLRRTAQTTSATAVKRYLGIGRSIDEAIAPLAEFNLYLEARRQELRKAPPAALAAAEMPSDLVQKLEKIHAAMRVRADALAEGAGKPPTVLSFLESFMAYFKVALVFGVFFSCPLILYEMWRFVGAGLYAHEQRYVLIFLPFSVGLFFGGALFGYLSVIPVALEFLAGWGTDLVELSFTLSNYLGLFFTLTVLLGLVFQTPLVMVFLEKIGAVGVEGFKKGRKWALLGSVVFAGVVTPPDPLSWLLVAAPIVLLYELGILIVRASSWKKSRKAAAVAVASPSGPALSPPSPPGTRA